MWGGVAMRKIVGALILVVSAALYRADDISRFWMRAEGPSPRSALGTPSASAEASPADSARKQGGQKRRIIPPDYKRNPLLFFSTAPKDSLVLLPGVGPVLAERIINARTGKRSFTRWDDLLAIKGIGPKTVDRLKRLAEEADAR
jgi:predicted flap endonuclease-1-like 5' DNA nuclease